MADMRVLFDAYWWGSGPISNRAVQRELISTWATVAPQDEVILAVRRGVPVPDVPPGVQVVRTDMWPHALANRFELPRLAHRVRADAIIAHNYAPWRTPRGTMSAVFLHDVIFIEHPEWFSRAERLYFSPMLSWAREADVVATSTLVEAQRIQRLGRGLDLPLAIGLGVPRTLTDAAHRRPALGEDIVGFAVTVGRLNVRKNLEGILAAVEWSERIDARHPLIVVGGTEHSGVPTEYSAGVRRSIAEGRIVMAGSVSDDQLAWLYANSSLAITLSRDEGFGMPAVEAAHFGAPLLVSDIPVFRETVGGCARFVSPDAAPGVIAAAMDRAWGVRPSESARTEAATRYTWEGAMRALRGALVAPGTITRPIPRSGDGRAVPHDGSSIPPRA